MSVIIILLIRFIDLFTFSCGTETSQLMSNQDSLQIVIGITSIQFQCLHSCQHDIIYDDIHELCMVSITVCMKITILVICCIGHQVTSALNSNYRYLHVVLQQTVMDMETEQTHIYLSSTHAYNINSSLPKVNATVGLSSYQLQKQQSNH